MTRLTLTHRELDDLCVLATSSDHQTFVGGTNHDSSASFEHYIGALEVAGEHASGLFEACVWARVDNAKTVEDHLLLARRNCPHNDDTPQSQSKPGFVYVLCLTPEERRSLLDDRRRNSH